MIPSNNIEIHEVDLVQTESHDNDEGTLYVDLSVDEQEMTRIYRNFPVDIYDAWLESDFAVDMYLTEIDAVYPCVEEDDEDE